VSCCGRDERGACSNPRAPTRLLNKRWVCVTLVASCLPEHMSFLSPSPHARVFVRQSPKLVVTVGAQSNVVQDGLVAYFPPSLSGFLYPSSGDSSGGYAVAFTGSNLGPSTAHLVLHFGGFQCVAAVRSGGNPLLFEVPTASPSSLQQAPTIFVRAGGGGLDTVLSCPVPASHVASLSPLACARAAWCLACSSLVFVCVCVCVHAGIAAVQVHSHSAGLCLAPAGAGRDLPVLVARGAVNTTVPAMHFSYDPPAIASVSPLIVEQGACVHVCLCACSLSQIVCIVACFAPLPPPSLRSLLVLLCVRCGKTCTGYPALGNFFVTITGTSFTALPDPSALVVTVSGKPCDSFVNRTHTSVSAPCGSG
jgi:hypothetical protein